VSTSSHRPPATRGTALAVLGLAVAASIASSAAYWAGTGIGEDWSPVAVALLVLSLATYRPAREIMVLGSACALIFAVVAVAQGGLSPLAVTVNAVGAAAPVLALTLGGAAFASTVVRNLETWQREEVTATVAEVELMRRSEQGEDRLDRVGILGHDVAPLFAEILKTGTIDRTHQARAAAVAQALRSVMVIEADRSWLDELVADLPTSDEFSDASVIDDDRLAESMTMQQRSSMRALIVALVQPGVIEPGSLQVLVQSSGRRCAVTLSAEPTESAGALPHLLEPFIAVLSTVFDDVEFDIVAPVATLRFTYDRL